MFGWERIHLSRAPICEASFMRTVSELGTGPSLEQGAHDVVVAPDLAFEGAARRFEDAHHHEALVHVLETLSKVQSFDASHDLAADDDFVEAVREVPAFLDFDSAPYFETPAASPRAA